MDDHLEGEVSLLRDEALKRMPDESFVIESGAKHRDLGANPLHHPSRLLRRMKIGLFRNSPMALFRGRFSIVGGA